MPNDCSCRVVISELLCYIQCKIDVIDEVSLLQICEGQFTEEEIDSARAILTDNSLTRRGVRKGDNKNKRNLQDIVKILKETDPATLPVFVARNINRLPPVTFDHVDVTSLLKDIVLLKKEIIHIKSDCAKQSDVDSLRKEINQHIERSKLPTTNVSGERPEGDEVHHLPVAQAQRAAAAAAVPAPLSQIRSATSNDVCMTRKRLAGRTADSLRAPNCVTNKQEGLIKESSDRDFVPVTYKKKKNRNREGRAVVQEQDSIIQAAPRTFCLYVSRLDISSTNDKLADYIKSKGESAVSIERIEPYKETSFASFKVTILSHKKNTFLNSDFWPIGIVFRPYWLKNNST
ncbi:uncharacterized protein LOC123699293 [Colias croceus]|uniref:uncharacterized protein LOC123699293 n=1 Tax=Colias crocea TaxID=72248 RepID=UPI001E27BF56|nr:uncharacterized protein LOC123699293 [Colias croceus]